MKATIYILILFLTVSYCIANEYATTDSGKRVLLKENGTWEVLEEKQIQAVTDAKLQKIINSLQKKYDEFSEITWYKHDLSSRYVNEEDFFIYIGKKENEKPWLRLRIQYVNYGGDWLFIKKFAIKTNSGVFEITPAYDDIKRDNNYQKTWEYYDGKFDQEVYRMINAVITSSNPMIRCYGEDTADDIYINDYQQQALKEMLEVYEEFGGTLDFK